MAIITRKEWVKARDKHKVPKGALKGTSIGDAFDSFHKVAKRGDEAKILKEASSLIKDLEKYQKAIGKKHKKFSDWIIDNVLDQLDELVDPAPVAKVEPPKLDAKDLGALDDLAPHIKGALATISQIPDGSVVQKAALRTREKSESWSVAAKDIIDTMNKAAATWDDLAKRSAKASKAVSDASLSKELKEISESWSNLHGRITKLTAYTTADDFQGQARFERDMTMEVSVVANSMQKLVDAAKASAKS